MFWDSGSYWTPSLLQSTRVILTLLISNDPLTRSENLVLVLTWNLTTSNTILWKRGEVAPKEQFLLFSQYFQYVKLHIHSWNVVVRFIFPSSANLICRGTDISNISESPFGFAITILDCIFYFGRAKRKVVTRHMRTAKARISLRIHAVLPLPSLSANRIIVYHKMFQWRVKVRMRPCDVQDDVLAYFSHAWRHFFARRCPYNPSLWTAKDLKGLLRLGLRHA